MEQESAETIALKALGWLIANEELLPIFLGATGTSAEDIRARAGAPDFMISVLDFLTMDDTWVVSFCDAERLSYEAPLRARQALPGGADVNWT